MIIDNYLCFDPPGSPRNLAQIAATYVSQNVIDLHIIGGGLPVLANGQGARDIGIGDDPAMKLLVQVITAFASAASAGTLAVSLQGATDDGSGNANAFSTWWTSPIYTTAQLNAGSRLFNMDMPRPPDGVAIPRFLRMSYAIASATMTAGTVVAAIVLDRDDAPYLSTDNSVYGGYPAGINVAN